MEHDKTKPFSNGQRFAMRPPPEDLSCDSQLPNTQPARGV